MAKGVRRLALVTSASAALVLGAALPASAQQSGLINVSVGDVTVLQDVHVGIGAQVAAELCGINVGPVAVLATQVVRTGDTRSVIQNPVPRL